MAGRLLQTMGLVLVLSACESPTSPDETYSEFTVSVQGETFVLRTTDLQTRQRAEENLKRLNRMFPAGPLLAGDGGFNAPWSWHFDPQRVRFVDAAIEICDGRPSYVESHLAEFATYCPWDGRVVAVHSAAR